MDLQTHHGLLPPENLFMHFTLDDSFSDGQQKQVNTLGLRIPRKFTFWVAKEPQREQRVLHNAGLNALMSLFIKFQQFFLGLSLSKSLLGPFPDSLKRNEFAEC